MWFTLGRRWCQQNHRVRYESTPFEYSETECWPNNLSTVYFFFFHSRSVFSREPLTRYCSLRGNIQHILCWDTYTIEKKKKYIPWVIERRKKHILHALNEKNARKTELAVIILVFFLYLSQFCLLVSQFSCSFFWAKI